MKEPYVPIRPGISEHLLRGDISAFEFGVYVIIHLQTDYGTGIWRGSAARIANTAPRGADLRKIQRALEHLTNLGLLKPFHTQGVRGNYPVLINKFTVRSGALKGQRLNAELTTDWHRSVYEPCAVDDAVSDAVDAPIQEVISKKQEGRRKSFATEKAPSQEGAALAALLSEGILQNNPTAKITDSQLRKWAYEADLMMRRDNRSFEQIRGLIEWSQADSFWKGNILSMGKLRDKFDQLTVKKNQKGANSHGSYRAKASNIETTLNGFRQLQQTRTH